MVEYFKRQTENKKNKAAGWHWHILRPPILLKMRFEKLKAFF